MDARLKGMDRRDVLGGCAVLAGVAALLEKATMFGGTSITSGGTFWIPVNSIMLEGGYEDNHDDALKFIQNAAVGNQNQKAVEAFLDNGQNFVDWCTDYLGWNWICNDCTQWGYPLGAYNEYCDYDGYREFGRSIKVGSTDHGDEQDAIDAYVEWNNLRWHAEENPNVELMYETAVDKLYTNDGGEVIGVRVADEDDSLKNFKARRGVVLATGSFD